MIITRPLGDTPRRPSEGSGKGGAGEIEILYNPQDQYVMPAVPTRISGLTSGPAVPRAALADPIEPDGQGNYIFAETDERYHAAVPFAAVAKTIAVFEQALGKPLRWAFREPQIHVVPDAGEMLNAFYSRDDGSLNFFHAVDPATHETVYSGDSGEIVSHETGHAILDSLRPAYFTSWWPETAAFHEAFGDVMSILMSLQDDRVVAKTVDQTGGDLSKPNIVSNMGETMGRTINHSEGRNVTGGDYGRTALNDFTWVDPADLPDRGPSHQLSSEAHSFSRLWTGATYDLLKGFADRAMQQGTPPAAALRAAGDEGLKLYANLFKTAPTGDFTYRDMAVALMKADRQYNGGKNVDLIRNVFTARRILPAASPADDGGARRVQFESAAAPSDKTRLVRVHLRGQEFGQFDGALVETPVDVDGSLTKDAEVTRRTQDNLKRLIAAGRIRYNDPSYQMKLPQDYFDANGRPYMGVVRWTDGQMVIERVKIAQ